MKDLQGNGALAVGVVVYGNRHYEHALEELADFLEKICADHPGTTFTAEPRNRATQLYADMMNIKQRPKKPTR